MAENTRIEWAHHTVNFWWGCTKVSPACANCYAERQDAHFHPAIPWQERCQGEQATSRHWGPEAPRFIRIDAASREAFRYQARAKTAGVRFRVFTNSMSDFFEDRGDLIGARLEALDVIRMTPNLDWIILTKRPEEIMWLLRQCLIPSYRSERYDLNAWLEAWLAGEYPGNVWLGATVENQEWADKRVPSLLAVPARVRFLSCEPLLGPVDLRLEDCWLGYTPTRELLHWVICGGESGPNARPMHPDWAGSVCDQCIASGVPFLFKQWGAWVPALEARDSWGLQLPYGTWQSWGSFRADGSWAPGVLSCKDGEMGMVRVPKHLAGRLLDGQVYDGYPEAQP